MRHHRLTRSAALGLALVALVALAAPTAAAQPHDLRSPDARDSTPAAQIPRDLRTPDTRDAAADRPVGHAIDEEQYIAAHDTEAPTPVRRHRRPRAARAIDRPRL